MDLNTVETVLRPRSRSQLPSWQDGDACLAGGTWLFSEPQLTTRRLVDLTSLGWSPHAIGPDGLTLAATCTFAQLDRLDLPPAWSAAPLIGQCCRALLGSFKIWNTATVGGNLCLALPAGPMTALAAALDARCTIWSADGAERDLPAMDFVLGPRRNALRPGEILRGLHIPTEALMRRTAFRRISLSPAGRSGALLIGTLEASGAVALTVTAAVRRPIRLAFDGLPDDAALAQAIAAAIPDALYHDDVHGRPDWRRHVTGLLAREIRDALGEGGSCI
ncbi:MULTISPECIES: FAD binding domain-containing protein [unclassified Methylobacterium]|jgi:CO/xanthine dehydrogenase FAD-binding subunit|uniref:FAD binding domain-containing protein n=1 Tax=unclassified Methylobacterium TaxID=2615210 RepID=UPI001353D537|nr:FAD binding domain-containing protein [Methylobacterium sp. 2A]MWV24148.1 FAD-binding molybdopterin dehydrogenase [Methylobacterium sp. 2A]